MLDKIKEIISKNNNLQDNKGIFFSVFDDKNLLLMSNGVLQTDKKLGDLIDLLYHGLVEKFPNGKKIIVDIVTDYQKETDMQKILGLATTEYGLFTINNETQKSGVILPNTAGINSIKDALVSIQKKYQISGNIEVFVFKTQRFVV